MIKESDNLKNENENEFLTFNIVKNGNIKYLVKENDIWEIITDVRIASKVHRYSEDANENYKNALSVIQKMNGRLRFEFSNFNLIKLENVRSHPTDHVYSIPLGMIIQNPNLSGLDWGECKQQESAPIKYECNDPTAQKVIEMCYEIYGYDNWDHWVSLNNVYELMYSYDPEFKFDEKFHKRFGYSANDRSSGPTARHQKPSNLLPPTEGGVSKEEAIRKINNLFKKFEAKYGAVAFRVED